MNAQFIAGKLICDHIISHLDGDNPQDQIIMLAEFAPWNGELKSEFASLLSKLIRLSERRPELAAIHTKLCEVLEEGEFPEWELARKKFRRHPNWGGRDQAVYKTYTKTRVCDTQNSVTKSTPPNRPIYGRIRVVGHRLEYGQKIE